MCDCIYARKRCMTIGIYKRCTSSYIHATSLPQLYRTFSTHANTPICSSALSAYNPCLTLVASNHIIKLKHVFRLGDYWFCIQYSMSQEEVQIEAKSSASLVRSDKITIIDFSWIFSPCIFLLIVPIFILNRS